MSDPRSFRLQDLLGGFPGCDFLAPEEIEALVEGRLRADREDEFREHMRSCGSCATLAADFELFQRIDSTEPARIDEQRSFRETDGRVREALGLARPATSRRRVRWLAAVAAAIVVAAVGLQLFRDRQTLLIDDIGSVALVAPPAVRGATLQQAWTDVGLAWDAGDMPAAVTALRSAVAEAPDDESLWFYLGYAHLRNGDAKAALEALRHADRLQQTTPSSHTRWLLAAALDRTGHTVEACDALRSVVAIGGGRASTAQRIVTESCAP